MAVSDGTGIIVAAGLTAVLVSGCTSLDGLTRIPDEAGSGAPNQQNEASSVPPDGSRDSSNEAARDHEGRSVDAALDHADGFVDAASDAPDSGHKDDAGDGWGWVEVSPELERQQGVVYVLGSRKNCSGVVVTHHWVLTAAHCLCYNDVGEPTTVRAHVGGSRLNNVPSPENSLYASRAARVVLHPTYDVALIELENAVPFKVTPLLYDGADGIDLTNKVGRAWGFGPNRLDDVGQPIRSGETLSSAALSIHGVGEVGPQFERVANCALRLEQRSSLGPLALPVDARTPMLPVEEAEGGPLFVGGDDPETRVLVGILKGTTDSAYAFTGIWPIRDWIRETATDVSSRQNCSEPVPGSTGMSKPAVTEGPDGTIHVVAVRTSDGTLHHWRRAADGTIAGPTGVPNARSDMLPGLAREGLAPAGESVQLGLAFRDPGTKDVKYSRWSPQTSWSEPITVPGTGNARAVALAGGVVSFVSSDQHIGTVGYHFEFGWGPVSLTPIGNIDVDRGLSAHYYDKDFVAVWNGYRTPRNEWVEILGTFRSVDGGLVWTWESKVPSAPTGWEHAVLSGSPKKGGMIVATRPAGAFSVVEHHLVFMPPTEPIRLFQIGSNRLKVEGEIAAGFAEPDDIWVVSQSVGAEPAGLMLRRSTDCFANDW